MPKKSNTSVSATDLRRRAEAELKALEANRQRRPMMAHVSRAVATQLRDRSAKPVPSKPAADTQRTLHELQVHQIELEMQNTELRDARDQIEAQLEKYTDLYDFAPVGYFSLDEQGRIQELNLTGAALLGVERIGLAAGRFSRFVAPASQPDFLAFLKRVFAGTGQEACDLAMVKEDGTDFWARFRGTAALSAREARKWCRVSVSDITALKQADDSLRKSEDRFRVAALAVSNLIWTNNAQGRMEGEQPGWAQFTGQTPEEYQGYGWAGAMHPDDAQPTIEAWNAAVAEKRLFEFEHRVRRHDGAWRMCSVRAVPVISGDGKIREWVGVHIDITERKKVEETQRRVEVLAASNRKLEKEIVRRIAGEKALQKSEQEQRRLLDQSLQMQEQLRLLSHQILQAQEEERKRISRELHDEIAQTLTGINIRLANLKAGSTTHAKNLQDQISSTQRLVEKSVEIVHRFARELRPSVLDDLGLIPALQAFVKTFAEETKLPVRLRVFAGVEKVDAAKRTVLYRVAQEALTNVARHAKATEVELCIDQVAAAVRLKIKDNGRAFSVKRTFEAKKNGRLGLLGMRERVEMVGGRFTVESAPGHGTTIEVQIPFSSARKRGKSPSRKRPA